MMGKKCKVCGKKLVLRKELRYCVIDVPLGLAALSEKAKTYECFDCLFCGCQNIVNIREGNS